MQPMCMDLSGMEKSSCGHYHMAEESLLILDYFNFMSTPDNSFEMR